MWAYLINSNLKGHSLQKKVKLSMNLIQHHIMKTHRGMEVKLCLFLILAIGKGEWLASHSGCFTPEERVLRTHWTRSWVGCIAVVDAIEKRKDSTSAGNQTSVIHDVDSHSADWVTLDPGHWLNL